MAGRTSRRRRTHRGIGWVPALIAIVVLVALIAAVATWIGRWGSRTPEPLLPPQGCVVTVEGFNSYLTWEQSGNAAIIVGESIRRGLPARMDILPPARHSFSQPVRPPCAVAWLSFR